MVPTPPTIDETITQIGAPTVESPKSRSSKQFFLASGAALAIGVGILGVLGFAAWLARNDLATSGLNAFLRSKGIPADVTIKNLQLDTAQIIDLRLGPQDRPSLVVKTTTIKWRVDSKARLFVIDRLVADDVTMRVRIDKDGKLDLGALGELIKPGTGPKRSVIDNASITNATLLLDTPLGQATSRLTVSGGEAQGWTGVAGITPPASMIVKPPPSMATFEPLRVGFALQQVPSSGSGDKATTLIGFSARPNGQSLAYQGLEALNLIGNITGQVALQEGGAIRIDTRPASMTVARVNGYGVDVAGLTIATNPIFWTHGAAWQTSGWGSIVATGSLEGWSISGAKLRVGQSRFRLGGARAQSGRVQLDYQGDIRSLSGPVVGQRIVAAGAISTTLKDLTQFGEATFNGKSRISATGIVVPPRVRASFPLSLPPAVLSAIDGTFSGSGAFDYQVTKAQRQISLNGPLVLTGSTGLRATLVPQDRSAPTLVLKNKADGTFTTSAIASGQASFDLPRLGAMRGTIDGATFGPNGWAFIGRNVTMNDVTLTPSLAAALRFDRLDLQGPQRGAVSGRAIGQATLRASPSGNAALGFDLVASPSAISGSIQGPIDGFGTTLGLGGYGVHRGNITLAGMAQRRGQAWIVESRGQVSATALSTDTLALTAPAVSLGVTGQLTDQGNLGGRVQFSGKATNATPNTSGNRAAFNGLSFDGAANLGGSLQRLAVAGNLDTTLGRGVVSDLQLDQGRSALQFAGSISASSAQLQGSSSVSIASLKRAQNSTSGQVSLTGLRSSGPFSLAATGTAARPAFWDGRLTLTSDVKLGLERFQAGSTRLSAVDAFIPLSASLGADKMWQARGRLTGQADLAALATTRFSALQLSGPFDAKSTSRGWQASGDVALAARSLIAGDTQLNSLTASGPLGVTSGDGGSLRVSSARCLDFAAASGTFPGDASVGAVSGKLCPQADGQIAVLGQSAPRLFATTQLSPLAIQIGDAITGQRVDLGDINGTLTTNPDGSLNMDMLATQFGLNLKLPDGQTAVIKANEAELVVVPQAGGIGLRGRIGRISSIGLPVLLSGSATTDLVAGSTGLAGTFNFDDIILKDADKSLRFGELQLTGSGTLAGNQVSILADVLEPASQIKMATVMLSHDIAGGFGNLDLTGQDILFSPEPIGGRPGLDIVTIVPPLRGVVSDMVGVANASANLAWSRTVPIVSRATIETKGLDFGTMLGPITGFTGDIRLDDILTVRTAGRQTIKIGLFDPGLPIVDGKVEFVLPGDNSLRLENASWPFADGTLSVRPATWAFRDGDQSFSIDVDNVDLAKLLRLTEVPNLEIDGRVSGVFPIEVRDGNVEIVGGRLKAREGGGVIRFTGANPSPPPPPPGFFARLRQRFMGKPPPVGADLAIEALRALEYKILEITVEGRITGELKMGVILEGANQQVLSGQPFKFNIKMNVPVGQLLDNLNRLNNIGSSPEVLAESDRILREEAARKAAAPAPLPVPPTPAPAPAPAPTPAPSTPPPPPSPAP